MNKKQCGAPYSIALKVIHEFRTLAFGCQLRVWQSTLRSPNEGRGYRGKERPPGTLKKNRLIKEGGTGEGTSPV